jgi:hypothetical protein
MRKRLTIGLAAFLLVGGLFGLLLWLRGPAEQPRYLRIERGMDWERVDEIMGDQPFETYMSVEKGLLRKSFKDVDGKALVVFDGDVVKDVQYVPDNPNPDFFERLAKSLRL